MPEGARRIESPYEVEVRYSIKRSMGWVGYKVHLTESCDKGFPHLITDVHTVAATATDAKQLSAIQQRLAASGVLPAEYLADSSCVSGSNLVRSHAYRIDHIGPAFKDDTWQAKAGEGFDVATLRIDWEKKAVTCSRERRSIRWSETETARGRSMIHMVFSLDDCAACPSRSSCTRARISHAPSPCSPRKCTRPSGSPEDARRPTKGSLASTPGGQA
jgi:transposase